MKALIVDDDDNLRGLLQLGAEEAGYAAETAKDTVAAKAWLQANVPDLILLDIMMPDGNGLDLCRWVRSQERLAKVAVIITSALKDEETEQDALELGAVDFLRKPFTMDGLKEKLERLKKR
jgi:DNA-binding response OmpR family regulator